MEKTKKKEIPSRKAPGLRSKDETGAQKAATNSREDIRAQQTDRVNPNSGPQQRSAKKKTKE